MLGNTYLVAWMFTFYMLIKLHTYFMLFLYMHHILQCHELKNTVRVRARVKEVISLLSCSG